MTIAYIANVRLPTEKAHGIQIARMCEAFASAGESVELVLPRRYNVMPGDLWKYYGVQKNFTVKRFFCLDFLWLPFAKRLWFAIQSITFVKTIRCFGLFTGRWTHHIVYTREAAIAAFPPPCARVIFEIHTIPKRKRIFMRALRRSDRLIVISSALKRDLVGLGLPEKKILVAPDAVDMAQFDIPLTSSEARKELNFPIEAEIIMYTGHLYAWKGVETLLAAAEMVPDRLFIFVGGTKEDQKRFLESARSIQNVLVLGHRSPGRIPYYLKAADALVIPNSATDAISLYTSPLKLFEYMAARRPVIASDLPSLREILDESTATFFAPDNTASLAQAIEAVFRHSEESAQKADRAYEKAKHCTWRNRAERIVEFII